MDLDKLKSDAESNSLLEELKSKYNKKCIDFKQDMLKKIKKEFRQLFEKEGFVVSDVKTSSGSIKHTATYKTTDIILSEIEDSTASFVIPLILQIITPDKTEYSLNIRRVYDEKPIQNVRSSTPKTPEEIAKENIKFYQEIINGERSYVIKYINKTKKEEYDTFTDLLTKL